MKAIDTRVLKLSLKLIVLLGLAFLVFIYAPQYAHHILLVIAGALLILGGGALLQYKAQTDWVETKAVLKDIKERVEEVALSENLRIKHFYPIVEYEYVANGSTHLGTCISFEKENIWVPEVNNWGDPTPAKARWWLALKPGAELSVYVNPRNEKEAVLIKDVAKSRRSHHLALLSSGIILALIWLFLANNL
ncbi:MAG: DUF3592 domain-containing protein [Gammaproteobacteria bacterium]|nr:MAG: DUF3592 domain-containing protein [Gammaproteobacteria bacterium]